MKRPGNPEGLREGADKRAIATHNALVEAYKRLERGEPTVVRKNAGMTASSVAREAGVDRGVLYGNHRDILERIQQTKIERKEGFGFRKRRRNTKEATLRIKEMKEVIDILQKDKTNIATALANSLLKEIELQNELERVTKERDELRQGWSNVRPMRAV